MKTHRGSIVANGEWVLFGVQELELVPERVGPVWWQNTGRQVGRSQ
jgi:hypothetical protein